MTSYANFLQKKPLPLLDAVLTHIVSLICSITKKNPFLPSSIMLACKMQISTDLGSKKA